MFILPGTSLKGRNTSVIPSESVERCATSLWCIKSVFQDPLRGGLASSQSYSREPGFSSGPWPEEG